MLGRDPRSTLNAEQCRGCQEAFQERSMQAIGNGTVYGSVADRDICYSHEGFQKHFETCERAAYTIIDADTASHGGYQGGRFIQDTPCTERKIIIPVSSDPSSNPLWPIKVNARVSPAILAWPARAFKMTNSGNSGLKTDRTRPNQRRMCPPKHREAHGQPSLQRSRATNCLCSTLT